MTAPTQPLAVVHYFYLLKDDRESLAGLWSRLGSGAALPQEPLADLGLAEPAPQLSGYCTIVSRMSAPEFDLCLLTLPSLSAVQVIYHGDPSQPLARRWAEALERLEADRRRLDETIAVFGETTLLVSQEAPGDAFRKTAAELSGTQLPLLMSQLKPALAGGGEPVLLAAATTAVGNRLFLALAAAAPEGIISEQIPQIDSLIKKLSRSCAYFREQRDTIIIEREGVDREVGALLHRQVMVRATGERPDAAALEEQIDSLSRMFGILATDTLLVRQAGDTLQKDIRLLEDGFDSLFKRGGEDRLGPHFLKRFHDELEPALEEQRNLDFSRQNALAAIEVVRTQVSLLRAGEEAGIQEQTRQLLSRSLVLQKERLSLQVAAGFIEFVIVFYYLFHAWAGVVGEEKVEHVAPLLKLLVIGGMSAGASLLTHYLAQFLQKRSWKSPGLWASAAIVVLSLAGMVILSL